jgi:hypothetical protein
LTNIITYDLKEGILKTINYKKFVESTQEIPFSRRLKYFMDLRNSSPSAIGLDSEVDFKRNLTSLIYKYLDEKKIPNRSTIYRIAKVLDIRPEHLMYDLGREFRALADCEDIKKNSFSEDFFNCNGEFCLYGRYVFDEYHSEEAQWFDFDGRARYNNEPFMLSSSEEREYIEIKAEEENALDRIEYTFNHMSEFKCYKFVKNIDAYSIIKGDIWVSLQNFAELNKKQKYELTNFIKRFEVSSETQLRNLKTRGLLAIVWASLTSDKELENNMNEELKKLIKESYSVTYGERLKIKLMLCQLSILLD